MHVLQTIPALIELFSLSIYGILIFIKIMTRWVHLNRHRRNYRRSQYTDGRLILIIDCRESDLPVYEDLLEIHQMTNAASKDLWSNGVVQ